MADFSLTTLFVVPVGQTAVPSSGSTQDLTAGQVGIFDQNYATVTAAGGANPASQMQSTFTSLKVEQTLIYKDLKDLTRLKDAQQLVLPAIQM